MVTEFYDLGANFSFAAQAAWVTYDLGAGGGGVLYFFAFNLKEILGCNNAFFCWFFPLSQL